MALVGGNMSNTNIVSDESSRGSIPPSPPPATLRLWTEVANGIDKSQTGEFNERYLCGV